jgi:hypothetical protein
LVVIDTLSASTPGADENLARDMGPVLRTLQDLARELALLIVVIAHPGKDEAKKIRGWSGLLANADGVILIENPDASGVRTGKVEKVKNGPAGGTFAFRLTKVILGKDKDGDDIDTCVVEEADPSEAEAPRESRKSKAGDSAKLILRALHLCIQVSWIPVNVEGATGLKGAKVADVRTKAYEIGLGGSEPDYPADPAEAKRARTKWLDQRKKDFDRGCERALATDLLRQHGDLIWETYAKKE